MDIMRLKCHVGVSTAYNLTRIIFMEDVDRFQPYCRMNLLESVLLCFGEADIRANVIKYCYQRDCLLKNV